FGSGQPLLLKDTTAALTGNFVQLLHGAAAALVTADSASKVRQMATRVCSGGAAPSLFPISTVLQGGAVVRLAGERLLGPMPLPVVEIDGLPVYAYARSEVFAQLPADMPDRIAPATALITLFNGLQASPAIRARLRWRSSPAPSIQELAHSSRDPGVVVVKVAGTQPASVLVNGRNALPVSARQTGGALQLTVRLPAQTPADYNVVVVRRSDVQSLWSAPVIAHASRAR
ncbi:MAG TPA: hypothetical protein VGS41_08270, partial [Chthonomonadales bacterium]|nr:hypothetical protein [Chthonomonadales bacterium]